MQRSKEESFQTTDRLGFQDVRYESVDVLLELDYVLGCAYDSFSMYFIGKV